MQGEYRTGASHEEERAMRQELARVKRRFARWAAATIMAAPFGVGAVLAFGDLKAQQSQVFLLPFVLGFGLVFLFCAWRAYANEHRKEQIEEHLRFF